MQFWITIIFGIWVYNWKGFETQHIIFPILIGKDWGIPLHVHVKLNMRNGDIVKKSTLNLWWQEIRLNLVRKHPLTTRYIFGIIVLGKVWEVVNSIMHYVESLNMGFPGLHGNGKDWGNWIMVILKTTGREWIRVSR